MNTAENPSPENARAPLGAMIGATTSAVQPPALSQGLLSALLEDHHRADPHHHDVCEICRATSAAIEAAKPKAWRVMVDREVQDGPLAALMARIDDTWTLWEALTTAQADVKRMMAEIETANGGAA